MRDIEITEPVEITLNGELVTAQNGELLIDACERNGSYIPRFCYHSRLTPVGMCRMCLVEVDTGRGPALQPSCMIPVSDGMGVDTESDGVAKAQDGVLEFLLANHPLDCPVCDKGGECPLQDQAYAYGPGESRFVEEKRHNEKPIPISELVLLDRERCILCDRCTRFADEVAGDPLIHFIHRGSHTEVNTFPGEPFASYFSGNTVQICPVGALTASPYRFKARPWDLEETESTCTRCSVGCRVVVESSRNKVLRLQGVDSDPVNWSWLCDKGRFGFQAGNSGNRLSRPLQRCESGELSEVGWNTALDSAASVISAAIAGRGPQSVAVLGGARLTNESAYSWAKLAKDVIGTDNVDCQLGDGLPAELVLGLPGASIDEVCEPGATVLYLGPDAKEELPILYLRLRHAADFDGVKIVEVGPTLTGLSPYAAESVTAVPGETPSVLAALLDGTSEHVEASALLRNASDLKVVIGRANLAEDEAITVQTADLIRESVPGATFLPALRRANVRGALEAGLAPGFLPGGATLAGTLPTGWQSMPAERGGGAAEILEDAANGRVDVLILLGSDPLRDFPDRSLARRALAGAKTVISIDPFVNASAEQADLVLAASMFSESAGTTTSLEGRVTALNQLVTPPGTARDDWMIAVDLADRLGADLGVETSADDLAEEMAGFSDAHVVLGDGAPVGDGVMLDISGRDLLTSAEVEVPPANAYSLRLVLNRTMYDKGTLLEESESSAGLAGESVVKLSAADAAPLGVDGSTQVKVTSEHGSVTVAATIDSRVPKGVAVMHHALGDVDAGTLLVHGDPVCDVRVEVS